jgi:hypothetical protein
MKTKYVAPSLTTVALQGDTLMFNPTSQGSNLPSEPVTPTGPSSVKEDAPFDTSGLWDSSFE